MPGEELVPAVGQIAGSLLQPANPQTILSMQPGLMAAQQFGLFGQYQPLATASMTASVFANQTPQALQALTGSDQDFLEEAGIRTASGKINYGYVILIVLIIFLIFLMRKG